MQLLCLKPFSIESPGFEIKTGKLSTSIDPPPTANPQSFKIINSNFSLRNINVKEADFCIVLYFVLFLSVKNKTVCPHTNLLKISNTAGFLD